MNIARANRNVRQEIAIARPRMRSSLWMVIDAVASSIVFGITLCTIA